MELSLQVQQKQILSQKMQQSVEILQMNAVTLSEYIREFAEENALVEWNEGEGARAAGNYKGELLQKLEWLEETDEQNRSLYRMEHEQEEEERGAECLRQKRGAESARISSFSDKYTKNSGRTFKPVLRFLAESTAESGYLAERMPFEMVDGKISDEKIYCRKNSGAVSSLASPAVWGQEIAGRAAHSAEAEKRLCSFHEDHKKLSG